MQFFLYRVNIWVNLYFVLKPFDSWQFIIYLDLTNGKRFTCDTQIQIFDGI